MKSKIESSSIEEYKPDEPMERKVTATIRDPKGLVTFEAIVDLTKQTIEGFRECREGQPGLTFDELIEADDALRASEALRTAFAKRNINMDEVVFYPFSSGFRDERDAGSKRRIFRPYAGVRKSPNDNYYAHHIDGLVITVDLDTFTVEVEDHQLIPVAKKSGNYDPEGIKSPDNVAVFSRRFKKRFETIGHYST